MKPPTPKQLAELRRDKARLDWLADPANPHGNVTLPRAIVERNLHSLRAAIDETMAHPSVNAVNPVTP